MRRDACAGATATIVRRDDRRGALATIVTAVLVLAGCRSTPSPMPLTIPFVARLGGKPFSCTTIASGVGAKRSAFAASDLELFVHGVELVTASGAVVPVALRDDGRWQAHGVALLDFEDGSGSCRDGTPAMHTSLEGDVTPGEYVALRFLVGVPFALNHANPAVAEPPLNAGHMHWSWESGYKFLRFEGSADGVGYRVHLGSTGCEGPIGAVSRCARPNRAAIALDGFRIGQSTVVLDLDGALHDVDLAAPPADGIPGCMGAADDPDCAPAFAALGLDPATGEPTRKQSAFSLQ